jgi:hypothetical protein
VHIDWLTVRQEHAEGVEFGSVMRVDYDVQTGEIETSRLLSDSVQGSWDTSLRVRCQAGAVEVSGNPSKFGRLDAITGYGDLWQCLEVYNSVLRELGLPEFERRGYWTDQAGERHYNGPTLSRVDLCRNLVVGRGGVKPWLDWLEAQRWGHRLPFARISANTVRAGSADRRARVSYDKGRELLANRAKWARSRALEKEDAVAYLDALIAWAESVGLVRDEIRLHRKWLNERPYKHAEFWTPETPAELFDANDEIRTLEAGAMTNYGDEIFERLQANGVGDRLAGQIAGRVQLWMNGQDWRFGLSRATQYRYARLAADCLGLDLLRPSNVRSLAVCVKPVVLEARQLTADQLPEWYQLPTAA